jgi:hypothetical protein
MSEQMMSSDVRNYQKLTSLVWIVSFFGALFLTAVYRLFPLVHGKYLIYPQQFSECVLAVTNIFIAPTISIAFFYFMDDAPAFEQRMAGKIGMLALVSSAASNVLVFMYLFAPTGFFMWVPPPDREITGLYNEVGIIAGIFNTAVASPLNVILFSKK